ncbi:unnamed protein product [Moneuplotes crassus]|uniref:Uncharacterized protein n=1 Tax=Euplotes crassus TaxID=5936 RepID=A0AAD1TZS8_EUPCR|nr:unnamed protein product [Moneuplotes crassus]
MGIPKFFRWLVRRYPMILADIKEENDVPPIDNLYLDLNGVVHNATHSNDPKKLERISKAKDFEVIWAEVVQYIDDIIHLVKPKEMIMFAVDGVAPRAKMNQQRSRRFKTAQERHELKKLADDALIEQDPELQVSDMFDVNSISPGTDFMVELNRKLDYYIQHKINTDPLYSKIKIILSGSDVPGEGEHKIMEYIREYKNSDYYHEGTRHCIYGQDADLIMLSLLSHEPNFTIIREEVKYKREQVEGIVRNEFIMTNNFQLLYLPVLRQYLDMEFKPVIEKLELEYNLERVIDDIIFFCFFVGNDFLPSLSVLDIAEASVDTLFEIYKTTLSDIGDYVTENGLIYWDRAEKLIEGLASHELDVLHSRMKKIMNFEKRAEDQEAQFFKGVQRIQYFKLKEKKHELIKQKKQNLVDRLVKEGKDKEYKRNKVANRPRELVKMKLEIKKKDKALKKRRDNDGQEYQSNSQKLPFGFIKTGSSDSSDNDNWLEEDYHEKPEESEELAEINQKPDGPDDATVKEEKKESKKEQVVEKAPENPEEGKTEAKKAPEDSKATGEDQEETIDTNVDTKNPEESKDFFDGDGELSDLDIKDLDDSDVSDVDIEELAEIEEGVEGSLNKDMIVQLKIAEESRRKNQSFVKNLCERYKENPNSAKAYYYKEKVDFDVYTIVGKECRNEMLREYLIGMQWVLFYYYRGVQHWGFYYKYHYPPMISDITNITELLGGTSTIENFDSCTSENRPFYPFEQLLTILPPDSIQNLLPKCYYDNFIENPTFKEFYPLTFDMDLNGRSMPWEAIVLIPFIDEKVLIAYEKQLSEEGKLVMEQKDIDRNKRGIQKMYYKEQTLSSFPIPEPEFHGFNFGEKNHCKIVEQPPDNEEYIGVHFIDYKMTHTKLVEDYPTLENLHISKVALLPRNMKGTRFEIPQVYIDHEWVKDFNITKLAKEFVSRKREAVYIDYPFKREAFVYSIISHDEYYDVYNSWLAGTDRRLIQETTDQQWYEATSNCDRALNAFNISCPKIDVIVGINRVTGVNWNQYTNTYEKEYKPEVEYFPLQMLSFDREDSHYLNLTKRIQEPLSRFETYRKVMLCDENFFGLTAMIKGPTPDGELNSNFRYYDVSINTKKEQSKIRDLFFAKNIIQKKMMHETKFSSIDHIAKRIRKSFQVINRITSSIFIKYVENGEKKTVDIGLKLRNNNKKLHIPIDVVYSEKVNKYTNYPEQFWGFSDKAERVIYDYLTTFPWLQDYIDARAHHEAGMRNNSYSSKDNRLNRLEDAMPFIETEEERVLELNRLTEWLSNCELANRSFVPAGFRFLSIESRDEIEKQLEEKKQEKSSKIPSELTKVDPRCIFAEMYPFWNGPFKYEVKSFRFGDRVANIDTSRRKYIPFGDIGTVVGYTLDKVIVRFDEPNVTLTDVHDTCPPYTGAVVAPNSLINLTHQAELKLQTKDKQNIRQAPPSKGKGGYQKNYREGPPQGKKGGYGQGKGHYGPSHGKEETKDSRGYTSYGKFNPKDRKRNKKNYEWA